MTMKSRQISRFAWRHYCDASLSIRWLTRLRPAICPLEVVAESVPVGARVLDVGCGAGLLLSWLVESRSLASGVGIDLSQRAIEIAKSATSDSRLRFEVRRTQEPWPVGPFDVVTLVDVLHHVEPNRQRAFVKRIGEINPKRVILKDLDPRPRWKAWMNALHDFLMTRRRVYPRKMTEVAAWLAEDGFNVVRVERLDRLWYSHYLIEATRTTSPSAD